MMLTSKKMDETFIKARCIDYILKSSASEEIIIIDEFSYADGARRADLICVTDHIHAYEIKSDLDSLKRLNVQLLDYKACFDFISIVTTSKHLSAIRNKVPKYVGIILVDEHAITQLRKPQKFKRFNKYLLSTMVDVNYVKKTLKERGQIIDHSMNAYEIRSLFASVFPSELLHSLVISNLKFKYIERFNRFMANRGQFTMIDDLPLLGNLRLW